MYAQIDVIIIRCLLSEFAWYDIIYTALHQWRGSSLITRTCISAGPKKVAQTLAGHFFKTRSRNFTELYTTLFQHVSNRIATFQANKTKNVAVWKYHGYSSLGGVWYAFCAINKYQDLLSQFRMQKQSTTDLYWLMQQLQELLRSIFQ